MASNFTQYDIKKACNGAKQAGLPIDRVCIGINGEIVIHIARDEKPAPAPTEEVENDGLDKWSKLYENRHDKAE